eukprot:CAMPEP_0168604216 /NCGR_PEP_ID=MMETSP0420-20121227/15171_1 /TAXON_ID=498008 /ORGANISM="Pessonella sp." /LENGTH=467 /DNA_ID=CAMNT_0008643303 /DNA_START=275 /DNA_END=1676 /DNA_ORIENTATION=+
MASAKFSVVDSETDLALLRALRAANDIDYSGEYIERLREEVSHHARTVLLLDDTKKGSEFERLSSCLGELRRVGIEFSNLAEKSAEALFAMTKGRADKLTFTHLPNNNNYNIDFSELDTKIDIDFIGNWFSSLLELVLLRHSHRLSARNCDRLCLQTAHYISDVMLQRTKTVEFSLAGGLLYAREAAELVRRLSDHCKEHSMSLSVAQAMQRVQAGAEVLSASCDEILDYCRAGLFQPLTPQQVASLVSQRVDITPDDVSKCRAALLTPHTPPSNTHTVVPHTAPHNRATPLTTTPGGPSFGGPSLPSSAPSRGAALSRPAELDSSEVTRRLTFDDDAAHVQSSSASSPVTLLSEPQQTYSQPQFQQQQTFPPQQPQQQQQPQYQQQQQSQYQQQQQQQQQSQYQQPQPQQQPAPASHWSTQWSSVEPTDDDTFALSFDATSSSAFSFAPHDNLNVDNDTVLDSAAW